MEQGSYSGTRSERAFGSKKEMDQEIHKNPIEVKLQTLLQSYNLKLLHKQQFKIHTNFHKTKPYRTTFVAKTKKLSTFVFKSKSNVVNKMRIHILHPQNKTTCHATSL
jgi:hypothetical protein